ncbi:hypothetical protein LWI29_030032 [Acer saccharum]|uniref:Uncharacterized protein n=1 Tax=Acer saccharum TaxID=4024 RepID=A0AA39W2S7_ACESA|nr:hypothetical protein LWI29_030032 [Acer saccharum]
MSHTHAQVTISITTMSHAQVAIFITTLSQVKEEQLRSIQGGRHDVRRKVATTSPAKITASSKEKRGLHDVRPSPAKSAPATTDGNDVALRSPPRSPPTSEPTASDLPLKRRRFGVATTFAAH